MGTIFWTRTSNPIPNYLNPIYPITISSRKLRNMNLIRVIRFWLSIPNYPNFFGNTIDYSLIHSLNPNNPIRNLYFYLLIACLFDLCNNSAICWFYFCISSLFTCCLMGEIKIWQLIGYFGKIRTRYFGYLKFRVLLFSGSIFRYPNFSLPELPERPGLILHH